MDRVPDAVAFLLRAENKPPVDLCDQLFGPFLKNTKEFVAWSGATKRWQLHLYGEPGCGKTVLASIIARHLRETQQLPVVTIFIHPSAARSTSLSVEDFLEAMFWQLCPSYPAERADSQFFLVPTRNETDVNSSNQRLRYLKASLVSQISASQLVFLIIDGFDWLSKPLQIAVNAELQTLGPEKLKILLTRRVPLSQQLGAQMLTYPCDECKDDQALKLYWECRDCAAQYGGSSQEPPAASRWILCYNCRGRNVECGIEGHIRPYSEPYSHVDVEVTASMLGWKTFVERDLQREFGLKGSQGLQTIKLSSSIIEHIARKSCRNMTMTKLRLDQTRELLSLQNIFDLSDRLPRGVIAFYDAEISSVEATTRQQRELVLAALAAAAENDGIRTDVLQEYLWSISGTFSPPVSRLHSDLEDILHYSRGLLRVLQRRVRCYHHDLGYYVREGYNRELIAANEKLKLVNAKRVEATPVLLMKPRNVAEREILPKSNIGTPGLNLPSKLIGTSSLPPVPDTTTGGQELTRSICAYCEHNLLRNGVLEGNHQQVIKDLILSAQNGCVLCSDIYDIYKPNMGKETGNLQRFTSSKCHWSLRTTGKTFNTQDIITLTIQALDLPIPASLKRYHFIADLDCGYTPHASQLGLSTHIMDAESRIMPTGRQIKKWLQNCNDKHASFCRKPALSYVPKRLLDISSKDNMIKVVERDKNSIKGPYVTLSHSWGTVPFKTLQRSNEAQFTTSGIHISDLTTNFQHAIQIARFLNMRYVWIDSLCIIQGKDGDFSHEGNYMHKVYRCSYCNIVAADSVDGTGGLFRLRDGKEGRHDVSDIVPASYEADGSGMLEKGTWKIINEDLWSKNLLASYAYTRGWVFQERMLSPRLLHFTATQIFWDCSSLSACETFPLGLPFPLDLQASTDRRWRGRLQENPSSSSSPSEPLLGPNDGSIEKFWKSSLLKYTTCNLTNQNDKSKAIWSIAKLVRDALSSEDEYGGGLWAIGLHEQLAWRVGSCVPNARLPELQYVNPSWSWASVSGPIVVQERIVQNRCYVVKNHSDREVRFEVEGTEARDKETMLKGIGAIEISGYLGKGMLIWNQEQGTYNLVVTTGGKAALGDFKTKGIFQVFPDEDLAAVQSYPRECYFVILAASSSQEHPSFLASSRRPVAEPTEPTAYSGIGLILDQQDQLKSLLRQCVRANPGDKNQYRDDLMERIITMQKWKTELKAKDKNKAASARFRRLAALHFREVSLEIWNAIKEGGQTKFWLE